jgi:hypothetical protein
MRRPGRVLFALALVLLTAGCAASHTAADENKERGFYGGVSVGGAVP